MKHTCHKDPERVTRELGEFEAELVSLIEEVYECCFTGKLEVIKLKPCGYQVKLGMPSIDRPISFAAEVCKDKFLKLFKTELRSAYHASVQRDTLQLQYRPDPPLRPFK